MLKIIKILMDNQQPRPFYNEIYSNSPNAGEVSKVNTYHLAWNMGKVQRLSFSKEYTQVSGSTQHPYRMKI